ncbi:hypothetical protein [Nonomuraea cavernae]|uniref:WD40 repeat domain-containing protein n=1 Tax=Nonomuraea cavernae TaxID=2045107 RepID=A0A917ZEM2_9ACTN|nr:hypothetical protein [Nonomuraea cavernae]MCA2190263.1 hypothetical protein [Nonomuraea cavernae]GGO80447.1 hypothetical protein GCM10012289_67120 [Nonomuraea cavernae]
MRHTTVSAALLVAAVIGGAAATPATAAAQEGPAVARAAWIKSCHDRKKDVDAPCGHWRLITRDGGGLALPDAAATRRHATGAVVHEPGRLAISGDGRVVAYERARDHRLVVRRVAGGPVKELPASLVPKGIGTDDLLLYVSPSGDKVLVEYLDDAERQPTRVVTVATGRTVELPARDSVQGFSADGDEVLATRGARDNTTALVAHRLGGASIRRTPPQVVANAAATALAADGRTVAVFVSGDADRGKPPRLRLYDLETGELSAGVDLALKPDATPYVARWTVDGRLVATVVSQEDGEPERVRVLTVDTETGDVTRTDHYSISKTGYESTKAGE